MLSSAGRSTGLLLDSSRVAWDNPAWTSYIRDLFDTATRNLGVTSEFKISFRSLLLIGGEDPSPEQQTYPQSDHRVFGSPVITLPSAHEGGVLSLTRDNKSKTFDTALGKYGASCIAWYNDTAVSVAPVTSGYRLSLSYNIHQTDNGPRHSASVAQHNVKKVEEALRSWRACLPEDLDLLVSPLENRCNKAALNLRNLRGQDEPECDVSKTPVEKKTSSSTCQTIIIDLT